MQIPEHYLKGCMSFPDKRERDALMAAIVFYLYSGEKIANAMRRRRV